MRASRTSPFMRLGNWFTTQLLRSPLHGLLSKSFMLISVTGRKTGKTHTTPVNFLRDGDNLLVVSLRSRTWWRNLRGGAPVTLLLRGARTSATATAIEDDAGVAQQLAAYLQSAPNTARYFGVRLDAQGQPMAQDVANAARSRVIVRVRPEVRAG